MTPIKVKDYFSGQASVYAAFRPTYPPELYDFIFRHLENHHLAWDCATGNGQVARALADYFDQVYATDVSQQQLDAAVKKDNIIYSLAPAEKTNFPNDQFDLVTVGQAFILSSSAMSHHVRVAPMLIPVAATRATSTSGLVNK